MMRKLAFWLLILLAAFLIFRISQILYYYSHELKDYVLGYLVGQLIMLAITGFVIAILGRRIYR